MENTNSKRYNFFLKGSNGIGVLLIHGITGTPSEMRYLGKGLNKAGYSVYCNTLPGHCDTLSRLKKATWPQIEASCIEDLRFLQKECSRVFAAGLSMGALMAIHLAKKFPSEVAGIIALAPTVFYDGWALHKGKFFMELTWHIPFIRNTVNIREDWPYGLKDEELRGSIERFYKGAQASQFSKRVFLFGSPFFPMASLYQHHLFTGVVKKELSTVTTPILVIHAKEDDMVSIKNAEFILKNIGSRDKTMVALEDSYHMVTIDKDKDRVVEETVKFLTRINSGL